MATTVVNYAGDGSTTQFTYSFDSLADTYVATKVTNETSVDITGNYTVSLDYDTSTVTITPAPAVGYTVEIKRATSTADDLFNFPAGTVMKPSDLEMALKTVRDYAEESADQISLQVDTISSAAIDDATSTALAYRDQAAASSTSAAASSTSAAASATAAAASETDAETAATNANTAKVGAELAESNAATSATNAATSETNAASSASAASTSATNASTSETNAASSASGAATSATNAATSETNAASSATNAASSATSAATAQTATEAARDEIKGLWFGAHTNVASDEAEVEAYITTNSYAKGAGDFYFDTTNDALRVWDGAAWQTGVSAADATNAAASAAAAATSEANAATSETNAATSAAAAATSATNAGTSETNAAASASAASTSETNAATSEANAASSLATFEGIWFGAHANAGGTHTEVGTYITNNSLTLGAGDLYFDTTNNGMQVYNGTSWVIGANPTSADAAAASASAAATSETNAANSASAASTSATNAGTSETNAANSASAASTSATNAGTSETNAASSASAAATSATNAGTSETNAASSASAAATSAADAQNVLNQFNDRYLGSHANVASDDAEVEAYIAGDPDITKDAGDIYFDSTNQVLKYYTVANGWLEAAATTVIDTSNLGNIGNVTITSVSTGDIIEWNGSQWVNIPNFSGSYTDLTNKPTIPANAGDLGDVTITAAATGEVLKYNGTAWVDANVDYSELTGVPSTFAPSAHTHAISEVTNLQTELDGKATTGHTHAVNDLTDVTVTAATTGEVLRYNGTAWVDAQLAYSDLSGTPTLATVATTGAYSDLTGTPTIPSNIEDLTNVTVTAAATGEVLRYDGAAWVDAVLNYSDLAGTPTLSTVATSGSYNDLTNKPTIPANVGDLGDVTITAATTGEVLRYNGTAWVDAQLAYGDLSGTPTLATVATSGAYSDLSGTPTIPSNVEDLTNVTVTAAATGEVLKYNGTAWVDANVDYTELTNVPATFAPSAHALGSHSDVSAVAATDGQVLTWNNTGGEWEAQTPTTYATTGKAIAMAIVFGG